MAKKKADNISTEEQAVEKPRTTRNGNKLFDGSEGNTFSSTNQPTPEQKRLGWAKKKAAEEFVRKTFGILDELVSDPKNLSNREKIELGKIAVDVSGLKKETQEINGDMKFTPTTFNILPVQGKDEH